jgi:threonine aldolase
MVERLREDHENARLLAEGLSSIEGIEIDLKRVQTNIVIFAVRHPKINASILTRRLREERILVHQIDVSRDDVLQARETIHKAMGT